MPPEYPAGGPEGPPEFASDEAEPEEAGAEEAGDELVFEATVVELSPPPQPLIETTPIAPQRAHPETLNFRFMDES